MLDIINFLTDYNIKFWLNGKNVHTGWVNISCPICDDTSNHGGFNIENGYYNCWRCGFHPIENVLSKLISESRNNVKQLIVKYTNFNARWHLLKNKKNDKSIVKNIDLPFGSDELKKIHISYLKKRGFNPTELERLYFIRGTNHLGDFKFRIIIPIYFNKKLVSYTSRDITEKKSIINRYKSCKKELEILHHKNIVYNFDNAINSDRVVIVEGVFDAWKLGRGSVALFGIDFTPMQIKLISENFKYVYILFDSEITAYRKAQKFSNILSSIGLNVEIIKISTNDPAELSDYDANFLMKNLLKN